MFFTFTCVVNSKELYCQYRVWNEIEDNAYKKDPETLVDNPGYLVEAGSLWKFDIFSLNEMLWRVVHNFLQFWILERLEIHVLNLHDDMKRNEMDDRVLDRVIEGEHVNVYVFTQDGRENLRESKQVADFWTIFNELVMLLVRKLHDWEPSLHLWWESKV